MSKSSIQTAPAGTTAFKVAAPANGTPPANGAPPVSPPGQDVGTAHGRPGPVRRILKPVASLRLTVFLFALSIVLIFCGTLAQMDAGIGTVVKDYFRSLYVWIPLQLFVRFGQVFFGVPHSAQVSGHFLFPGGWLIGGLMLVNLIAAHATRFRFIWKRSGILILHAGVLVLMAGELLTGLFAVEGQMTIPKQGVSNVIKHRETPELAVTGPLESAPDDVTVVSAKRLREGGVIQDDQLPFDVQVDDYMPNSRLSDAPLEYSVPKGWREGDTLVKSGIRRDAVFVVGDGDKTAEVSITTAAGGLRANIDRWRKQVGLEPLTDEQFERDIPKLEVVGRQALYVDLSASEGGPDRTRILGVAAPRLLQSTFIVMRGPADVVGQHKTDFEAFVRTLHADSRATAGEGVGLLAEASREGAGVDAEQRVDLASALVTLKRKDNGESLGAYLVSDWLSELPLVERGDQTVKVDGKTYGIALRFKRAYTPYTFQLLEFHHDNYPGTTIPNNFSSQVRILDPEQHVDREVNIHMNVPLRYQRTSHEPWWQLLTKGQETYYQQGFTQNEDQTVDTGTILQVVRNPGWLAPYLACTLVAFGMVLHFTITLFDFLRKRRLAGASRLQASGPKWLMPAAFGVEAFAACVVVVLYMTGFYLASAAGFLAVYAGALVLLRRASHGSRVPDSSDGFARMFPWLVLAGAGLVVVVAMLPPREESSKMHLQDFASLPVQADGRIKPLDTVARVTLASISTKQTVEDANKVSHPAIEWLADLMTFKPECLAKLEGVLPEKPTRAPHSEAVFRIEDDQLLTELGLPRREGLRYSYKEFMDKLPKVLANAQAARKVPENERSLYQTHAIELGHRFTAYVEVAEADAPRLIPPKNPTPNGDWVTLPQAVDELAAGRKDPATIAVLRMLLAYARDMPKEFNESLKEYRSLVAAKFPTETAKAEFETFFNNFAPFYVCMPLYVGALLLAALSWIGWSRPFNRAAFWLAVLGLVIHTFGLATRMYLQGRPPVTNLYSSAVYIGWMSVLLGLALEVIFDLGIGNALAGAMGFAGVVIAHNLSTGDTLELMRAVLDTNFWLATHVVCVSTGYAATMLAGFLGIFYILTNLLGWSPGAGRGRNPVTQMLYGVLCFATLFSFVGTVLGGIWADQSWGRFWGWDPKENGALLIVVMNALILHARWGGLVKDRGVAVLAVCGNIITGWSWFGTNQLGVGLHSYGFTSGLALTLTLFWASQVLVIGLGLVPMRYWRGANNKASSAGNLGSLPS
jgi:ABC-type transport system involved in cytochrome c biogenesis permease subunit